MVCARTLFPAQVIGKAPTPACSMPEATLRLASEEHTG